MTGTWRGSIDLRLFDEGGSLFVDTIIRRHYLSNETLMHVGDQDIKVPIDGRVEWASLLCWSWPVPLASAP